MALNGVIDAAVMGGTDKYREAFFTPTYAQKYPDHSGFVKQLQEDIMKQLDILERGVKASARDGCFGCAQVSPNSSVSCPPALSQTLHPNPGAWHAVSG